MDRKRRSQRILAAILAAVLLAFTGRIVFDMQFVVIDGVLFSRNARQVDLKGHTIGDYRLLQKFRDPQTLDVRNTDLTAQQWRILTEKRPDCQILWDVLYQGEAYAPDVEAISIQCLETGDETLLQDLTALQTAEVLSCRDYQELKLFLKDHPDCVTQYSVELSGENLAPDTEELDLIDADPRELEERLPLLPELENAALTGELPPAAKLLSIRKKFPGIRFSWTVELGTLTLDCDTETISLKDSGIENRKKLEDILPYLPEIKSVDLTDSLLPGKDCAALIQLYPEIDFQWEVNVGTQSFPNDAKEVQLSGQKFSSLDELRQIIESFRNLKKLTVLDSGLTNQDLDSLNREYPNIQVVWNLSIGKVEMRTDSICYVPGRVENTIVNDETVELLRYCPELLYIDVRDGFLSDCDWLAYTPKVRYLVLGHTNVMDLSPVGELQDLRYLELDRTQLQDYSPLLNCKKLEDLNLCYSYGAPASIQKMTWLKRLWWDGVRCDHQELITALPETEVEFKSFEASGGAWYQCENCQAMEMLLENP